VKPTTRDAYKLMHDGARALALVEEAGMRIDDDRLEKTIVDVGERIESLQDEQKESETWELWKRRFGSKSNMGSREQLGKVLVEDMGYKVDAITGTGRIQMGEYQLSKIDSDFARRYLEIEKLKKLRGTYLKGIRREVVDDYLHPVFNLNLVKTYRSSSSEPNFQNIPIRDKQIGKLIRTCFVPRDGHVLVEIDYSALEVRIAACYHKDPVMLQYIDDPSKDMHRDMAMECYKLSSDEVNKDTRFYAKNQYVFPEFYGSYWGQCAPNLWEAIDRAGLVTANDVPLKEHLKSHGIRRLGNKKDAGKGTFMGHIRQVEDRFWGERFKVYAAWKEWWWSTYQRMGWVPLKTGFRCQGLMKRNDVINYPVQGAAFHCLLWSLIQMVKLTRKWRSKIVGQIHDSIVADIHIDELDKFLRLAKDVMTTRIRDEWPWIIVPLEIEAEVAETNWFEKQEVSIP